MTPMSSQSWVNARTAFREAAAWFVRSTACGDGKWDEQALGEWTVRDLVGHTSRALLTIEAYLDQPVESIEVTSPTEYFRRALASVGDPAAVGQEADVPEAAALDSLTLLGGLAPGSGRAAPLLRAATGPGNLPSGFTVL